MRSHLISQTNLVCTVIVLALLQAVSVAAERIQMVKQNSVVEVEAISKRAYQNPFVEVTVDAVVTTPAGKSLRVPAFWKGNDQWAFRYASAELGVHTWILDCSDKTNSGLHGLVGSIQVKPYLGANPLLRHGAVRISDGSRHFSHADGTPFFWLADTWWKGLCKRLTWDGFQELTDDRVKKGFTAIQIVCGPYPDEGMMEGRWENEGGMPYTAKDFSVINPAYFEFADRRIAHLVEAGLVPVIVGGWGRPQGGGRSTLDQVGIAGFKRHWRNLIARYGAYPTIWIVGGEAKDEWGPWSELAKYLDDTDPYQRPMTYHSPEHPRKSIKDNAVFDFDMVAIGHSGFQTAKETLDIMKSSLVDKPQRPVLCGEACYEGHMQSNFQDVQRHLFWTFILSGAAGHTYGAAGIWHAGIEGDAGHTGLKGQEYDFTTWKEGMVYPGAYQIGLGKKLIEKFQWHRFETHPEWVEEGCFAAGISGEVRVIYRPKGANYDWSGPLVKNLEPTVDWHAYYFDPASGRVFDQGIIKATASQTEEAAKPLEYRKNIPSPQDWVLVLERVTARDGSRYTDPK